MCKFKNMKTRYNYISIPTGLLISLAAFLLPVSLDAQRMNHAPASGQNRSSMSRPAQSPNASINGGNQKSSYQNNANARPSQDAKKPATQPSTGTKNNVSGSKGNIDNNNKNTNINNSKNVNVNNSKNVNINNSHTTVVIANTRPYPRPPYVYGGHSYYCYHPYYYHPYHPYYWGPVYHPAGFFIATLAVTAVIISVQSQQYYYDQGVYYVASNGGYTVVPAPVGATVTTLPQNSQTVVINETTNNYYYGDTYYEKTDKGYTVVPPTAGTVVENLPEGGEEVKIGDVTYVKIGTIYYQPIQQDGKSMYEVVEVKEGE